MLLSKRAPRIETLSTQTTQAYRHLDEKAVAVLRWLIANRIDFVLVGDVARAIRGDRQATGPVSIVPAPYGRNLDRLIGALHAAHARRRVDGDPVRDSQVASQPLKLTSEGIVGADRLTLRCGVHDLDVEGRPKGVPRYQELLYEATRFELAPEVKLEVASPEDIEHYEHVRLTGASPEIRIKRSSLIEQH